VSAGLAMGDSQNPNPDFITALLMVADNQRSCEQQEPWHLAQQGRRNDRRGTLSRKGWHPGWLPVLANPERVLDLNLPLAEFSRAGYRVIAFDRRGWGKSMADPATGPQPGSISGDLAALADHLGLDRFHLVGVAGGGFAAIDYAAWHPERLRSLVVGASTGQFSEKEIEDFRARVKRKRLGKARRRPSRFLERCYRS
jgi:pimeloyl-ACP methyl ester carboxylesterase